VHAGEVGCYLAAVGRCRPSLEVFAVDETPWKPAQRERRMTFWAALSSAAVIVTVLASRSAAPGRPRLRILSTAFVHALQHRDVLDLDCLGCGPPREGRETADAHGS